MAAPKITIHNHYGTKDDLAEEKRLLLAPLKRVAASLEDAHSTLSRLSRGSATGQTEVIIEEVSVQAQQGSQALKELIMSIERFS